MSLSEEEIERYARHIVLREVGGPGQPKLRRARVLVVGAGGLGAPAAAISRCSRRRHARRRRRRHGLALQSAATGHPRHARYRAAQDRQRRGTHSPLNPACRASKPTRRGSTAGNAHRADRRLRPRRRRLGQFRDPLSGVRRLLSRRQAAGHGRARHLRRLADHDPRRTRRDADGRTESDLSLPVSGAAAARHACRLARRPACLARSPACWAR